MISRILIPQAFENMEEATIGAWLKKEGDEVHIGDALCELITEKTTFDLPAEEQGTLRRIVAPEKSVVPVGFVIGLLGDAADELPDVSAENEATRARRASSSEKPADTLAVPSLSSTPSPAPTASNAVSAPAGGSRVRATPAARRVAREKNVEIEAVAAAFPR